MIDAALIHDCRELAHAVAPELQSRPLTIVDTAELGGLPAGGNSYCFGWADAGSMFQYPFAEKLGDRYQGGAVVALNSQSLADAARPGMFRECVLNTMMHEVGHLVPLPQQRPTDLGLGFSHDELLGLQTRLAERAWADPAKYTPIDTAHDWRFLRRCIHLWVRSIEAGYSIFLRGLFTPSRWRSGEEVYLTFVLPEALRMRGESFATIEATPPPQALLDQWESDVRHYGNLVSSKETI